MYHFDDLVQKDVDLTSYNTLHVQVCANLFLQVQSAEQLQKILHENHQNHPVFVLGGGSNILFVEDYEGLIIQPAISGKEVVKEDDKHVWLKIGAGENWHQAVRYCVKKGWGGIENLSLIPGWAGAAPIQNIGAYGVEFEQVFESLTAVELETGEPQTFHEKDCEFGYRDSIFKNQLKEKFVITDVTVKLDKYPELNTSYGAIQEKLAQKDIKTPTIVDISDIVIEIRNSKLPDPENLANAGSFFKNPIIEDRGFQQLKLAFPSIPGYSVGNRRTKVPAGWLIEQTGWKGKIVGNVGTYRQQALVLVNRGGATGEEILALSKKIQQSVLQKFNVQLVPEVNIIG